MANLMLTFTVLTIALVQCIQYSSATTYYCPPPPLISYGGFSPKQKSYPVGSNIEFSCNSGHVLIGQRWTECILSHGRPVWKHPNPICKVITCPKLPDPRYGSVSFSNQIPIPGTVATYDCDRGFKLFGSSKRVCQKNRRWSGSEPVCKPIPCPKLRDPRYGSVSFSNRIPIPGTVATYDCDRGFKLFGSSKRVCQKNRRWSGSEPVCKPRIVDCGHPPTIKNGVVKFTTTTKGSEAWHICNKGFILLGNEVRFCQSNGKWSGSTPICVY